MNKLTKIAATLSLLAISTWTWTGAQAIPTGYSLISPPEKAKRVTPWTCGNVLSKNSQAYLAIQYYAKYKNSDLLKSSVAARTLIMLSPACKSLGMAGYTGMWSYKHYGINGKWVIKSFPMTKQTYTQNARKTKKKLLSCMLPYDWIKGRKDNLVGCTSFTLAGHINKH